MPFDVGGIKITKHKIFHLADTFEGQSAYSFAICARLKGLTVDVGRVRIDGILHKYRVSVHREGWDRLTNGGRDGINRNYYNIKATMRDLDNHRLLLFDTDEIRPPLIAVNQDLLDMVASDMIEDLLRIKVSLPALNCIKCAYEFLLETNFEVGTSKYEEIKSYISTLPHLFGYGCGSTRLQKFTLGLKAKLKQFFKL